jgi:hypothetical protein
VKRYRICGLTLSSVLALPELELSDAPESDLSFDLVEGRPATQDTMDWFHRWLLPDGATWLAFGRLGGDYLLRFPGRADFLVRSSGREIRCHPSANVPGETLRHLLLDQVIPLALSHGGRLVLHASAVATAGGAVAFLGRTGEGKSTLSAAFAQDGWQILTDDALAIEETGGRLTGLPSYPGLRLWPEPAVALFGDGPALEPVADYTDKRRLGPDHSGVTFCRERSSIRRLYFLSPRESAEDGKVVRITPLGPPDALIALVAHSYHLDVGDRERLRRDFERLTRVVALGRCYRLAYPRDLALLPAVRGAVRDQLAGAE